MLPSAESSGTGGWRKSIGLMPARRAGWIAAHVALFGLGASRASSAATAASLARVAATSSSVTSASVESPARLVASDARLTSASQPLGVRDFVVAIRGRAARKRVRIARVRVGIIRASDVAGTPVAGPAGIEEARALDIADVAGRTNRFGAAAGKRCRTGGQRADTAADDHAADRNGAGGVHEAS